MTKAESVRGELMLAINRSELIHDVSHLNIKVVSKGTLFWQKNEIQISGRLDSENEKTELDRIISEMQNGVPIIAAVRVNTRY